MRANKAYRFRGWSTGLSIVLLVVGLALVLAGQKSVENQVFEVPVFTAVLEDSDRAVELRTARGDWAQSIPSGEDVSVRLTLDAEIVNPGSSSPGELLLLNEVYAAPGPQIEARLEIRGVAVHPAGSILQPLAATQPARLFWRINAPRAGAYEGTIWVYVNFVQPGAEPSRQLVLARPVTLTAVDVFGIPPHQVRRIGWIFLGLALIAAMPLGRSLFVRFWARVRKERVSDR